VQYKPTVGFGIVRASEKRNKKGEAITLQGGYTWDRKARNRALKDALSHAGFAARAAEIVDEAELDVPDDAVLDTHQAQRAAEIEASLRGMGPVGPAELGQPANFQGFDDEPQPPADAEEGEYRVADEPPAPEPPAQTSRPRCMTKCRNLRQPWAQL